MPEGKIIPFPPEIMERVERELLNRAASDNPEQQTPAELMFDDGA